MIRKGVAGAGATSSPARAHFVPIGDRMICLVRLVLAASALLVYAYRHGLVKPVSRES